MTNRRGSAFAHVGRPVARANALPIRQNRGAGLLAGRPGFFVPFTLKKSRSEGLRRTAAILDVLRYPRSR